MIFTSILLAMDLLKNIFIKFVIDNNLGKKHQIPWFT